jgi:inhibitor of cysteine peptidase
MKTLLLMVALSLCVARIVSAEETVREGPIAIEAEVGKLFAITLDANPTTGYTWQFAQPLDASILKLAGSEFKRTDDKLIGSGGQQVWTFRALDQGATTISLKYVRPWEKDAPPARIVTYTVTVR